MGLTTRRLPAALLLLAVCALGVASAGCGDEGASTAVPTAGTTEPPAGTEPAPTSSASSTAAGTTAATTTTGGTTATTPTATEPPPAGTTAPPPSTTTTRTQPPPVTTTTPPRPPSRLLLGLQDDALLTSAEPNALPATRGLGPRVVRYNVAWDAVAPRRPRHPENPADRAYDWTRADLLVRRARSLGAQVVLSIVQAPTWANGGRPGRYAPTDPNEFGRFCEAVATRYSGRFKGLPAVRRYTVWNEANRGQYLRPQGVHGEVAPRLYAGLAKACVPAIERANPRAQVAIGPLASRGAQHGLAPLPFLAGYLRAGGPVPKAFALNAYQSGLLPDYQPTEQAEGGAITLRNLDQLQQALRRAAGREVPVWVTEFAWRTAPNPVLGTLSDQEQADLLERTVGLVRTRMPYVRMMVWFLVRDESPTSYWRSGLVTYGWARKPAYAVFARLADDAAPGRGDASR